MSGPPASTPLGANSSHVPSSAEMEQTFWSHEGSPNAYMFYQVIGCTMAAMVCTSIWGNTVRYYEWFGKSDLTWVKIAVGAGTAITTGGLIMDMVQLRLITDHIFFDYYKIQQRDGLINLVKAFTSSISAFFACLFYGWKIYTLWGRRWYVLLIATLATIGHGTLNFYVNIWMFRIPPFDLGDFGKLADFNSFSYGWTRIFVWVNLAHDLVLSIMLFVSLHQTKGRLFHLGTNLFPKLVIIIVECMLPPMIVSAVDLAGSLNGASEGHGWPTMLYSAYGPLYFHSVLLSLVSRRKLRDLLDDNLVSNGIVKLGNASPNGGMYSGTPLDTVSICVEQTSVSHIVTKDRPRLNRDLAAEMPPPTRTTRSLATSLNTGRSTSCEMCSPPLEKDLC